MDITSKCNLPFLNPEFSTALGIYAKVFERRPLTTLRRFKPRDTPDFLEISRADLKLAGREN